MSTPKGQHAEHVHGPGCNHDGDQEQGEDHQHAGQVPYRREAPKPGRNDPCFCGSGRKYKKCHGAADSA
jgi:uncharacterized protein YchJ